jgi:FecR-like protein/tetratricopeptide repeat protein
VTCPRLRDAATREPGLDAELTEHIAGCIACRRAQDQVAAVVAMARRLPYAPPPRRVVEDMRSTVLASLPLGGPRRWLRPRTLIAAGVAAALAVVAVRAVLPSGAPRSRATVEPIGAAAYVHTSSAPDEIVRLAEGTLHVQVAPLDAGERFRIVAGDGDVEVRGTAFEVEVHGDRIARVAVEHGRVEVRTRGAVQILDAGQRWQRPREVVVAPPIAAPPAAHEPVPRAAGPAGATHPAASPTTPARAAERAFRTGWSALGAGDAGAAATAFERATVLDPQGSVAEDAAYWRAVALSRARRTEAARQAFERFLTRFPGSVRAGEAAVALGRMLSAAGQHDDAAAQFRRGLADPSARVQADAAAGLAELARIR